MAKAKTKPKTIPKKKTPAKPPPRTAKVQKNPEHVISGLRAALKTLRQDTDRAYNELAGTASHTFNELSTLRAYLNARYTAAGVRAILKRLPGGEGGAGRAKYATKIGKADRSLDLLTIASNTSWKNDVEDLRTRLRATESRATQLQAEHAAMRKDRGGAIRDMNRLLDENKALMHGRNTAINERDLGARVVLIMEDGMITAPYSLAPVPVHILVVNKDDAKVLPAREVVDCALYEIFAEPLSPHLYAEHAHDTAVEIVSACADPKIRETAESGGAGRVFDAMDERVSSHLNGVDTTPSAEESEEPGTAGEEEVAP